MCTVPVPADANDKLLSTNSQYSSIMITDFYILRFGPPGRAEVQSMRPVMTTPERESLVILYETELVGCNEKSRKV